MTERSSRWLLQDCEVVHFNGERMKNLKRRKQGKELVRSWPKLRSKLVVAFCPPTYILKHLPPLSRKNGSKSSCMDVHFNKENPKSSCTLSLPTMVPLKELMSYEDEEVNEGEEDLNQF